MPDDGAFGDESLSVSFSFFDGADERVGAGLVPVPDADPGEGRELRRLHGHGVNLPSRRPTHSLLRSKSLIKGCHLVTLFFFFCVTPVEPRNFLGHYVERL